MKSPNPTWFYALLSDIAPQFEWEIVRNSVRAVDEVGREYCPITAIYNVKTNQYLPPSSALTAGHMCGMKLDIINLIVDSADNVNVPGSCFSKLVRDNIRKAVGI